MRVLPKAALVVAGLAVLVCGGVYFYAARSLPHMNGTVRIAGLSAQVDIIRDADAIPHIFASTKRDGLFALGYVHAQDRLWQMELQRRIGFGRLSEIFGDPTLPQDRVLRTVGFGRAARAAWARLPPAIKGEVDAYVAGVNAFVSSHHGNALPLEFSLLRFEPEPWDGPDVVVWQKMVAWDLSGNSSLEQLRNDILTAVGPERMAELMPPYAANGPSILSQRDLHALALAPRMPGIGGGLGVAQGFSPARRTLADAQSFLLGGSRTEALGSNNWVVDGSLTASGRPLLANDPHLNARMPSIWYLAHVSAPDYDAIGASFPGTPGIILGRNRDIAWGATNVGADVEDLYQEKLDASGRFAEFQGKQEALQIASETIAVKGLPPVRLEVRISRHGPLVSDAINANNAENPSRRKLRPVAPLALRWTGLDADDTTIVAMMRISETHNWAEFTAALRDFVVPAQNFVYADTAGHIGYYAPGRIPVRPSGDGTLPTPGWTGETEWSGWVPFDELPHVYDPPGHVIITANQRPAPADYPHLLSADWPEPYRALRIADLLRGRTKLTTADFAAIQADTFSRHAEQLLPRLLAHVRPGLGGSPGIPGSSDEAGQTADRQAVDRLRQWNYDARGDSAAAAIFEAWFLHLAPALVGDTLGGRLTLEYEARFSFVTRFALSVLDAKPAPPGIHGTGGGVNHATPGSWCDDAATPEVETCDLAVTQALHDAIADLTLELGRDMTRWRWDAVHRARFPHQLGTVWALGWFLNRSAPSGGDWSTVDVGAVSIESLYDQRAVSSYREIIDLSPANDSRFIDAVGQSGHPLSAHYDDFLQDWSAVKHRPMRTERSEIERGAIGHLRLTPDKVKTQN